jgi:hypothetical protein
VGDPALVLGRNLEFDRAQHACVDREIRRIYGHLWANYST